MKLQCDARILSKSGILLFTQRHLAECRVTILPGRDGLMEIELKPNRGVKLRRAELQNDLLECEFLAERYREILHLQRRTIQSTCSWTLFR